MREIQLKTGFEFLIVVHAYSHSFPATHIFIKYGAPLDSFLVSQSFIKPPPPRPPLKWPERILQWKPQKWF